MGTETVFLLGATGYIGGSIFQALLDLPSPPARITCLVRDPTKAKSILSLAHPDSVKLETIVGSLSEAHDANAISQAAEDHDVVINAATADEESWLDPVFRGIARRKEATGNTSVFIHTSGTGMFQDKAMGMNEGDKIYTDVDSADSPYLSITSLDPTIRHRRTDLAILPHDTTQHSCRIYIVVPCHIWDYAPGEIFDRGISHNTTIAFPWQVEESLKVGQSILTGKGLNRWDHVHITDTAALYMLVYTQALSDSIPHGEEGYYLACAGDYSSLDIGRAIGEEMVELGLAKTAEVTSFAEDDTRYRVSFSGTNARAVGQRAKSIGWTPKYEKLEDLLGYVKKEVRTIAAKRQ